MGRRFWPQSCAVKRAKPWACFNTAGVAVTFFALTGIVAPAMLNSRQLRIWLPLKAAEVKVVLTSRAYRKGRPAT
jgi:hypothetical protein